MANLFPCTGTSDPSSPFNSSCWQDYIKQCLTAAGCDWRTICDYDTICGGGQRGCPRTCGCNPFTTSVSGFGCDLQDPDCFLNGSYSFSGSYQCTWAGGSVETNCESGIVYVYDSYLEKYVDITPLRIDIHCVYSNGNYWWIATGNAGNCATYEGQWPAYETDTCPIPAGGVGLSITSTWRGDDGIDNDPPCLYTNITLGA